MVFRSGVSNNDGTEFKAIDLRMSIVKPLGAKWLIALYHYFENNPSICINGYKEAGILDCIPQWFDFHNYYEQNYYN